MAAQNSQNGVPADRALIWLVAAALVVRIMLVASSASMPLQVQDERHYAQLASSLLHRGEFAMSPGELSSMRPPLYPAFVASLWKATGIEDAQVVRAAQIGVGVLLVIVTYLLTLRLFGRRAAIAAGGVTAFYPSLLYAGLLVLTELLFATFVVVFVLLFTKIVERPRAGIALTTGAVLACAALTRSVLWPFPVLLTPFLLFTIPGSFRQRAGITVCCLAGFVLVVGPWAVRNTRLQKTFTVVDSMGGMNLMMGNYEHTPEDRMWAAVAIEDEREWSHALRALPEARTWTVGQKEKWAQREAVAYMVENPGITFRRSLLKFADFWGLEREMVAALMNGLYHPPRWFALLATVSVVLAYPIVALGAALGVCSVVPRDRRTHWLILLVILFVTAVHSLVFGHSRYHLPLVPFLAMYAGAAWSHGSWRDLFNSPSRAIAPGALMTVLVVVWSHEVLFRDADRIRALVQALR